MYDEPRHLKDREIKSRYPCIRQGVPRGAGECPPEPGQLPHLVAPSRAPRRTAMRDAQPRRSDFREGQQDL